MTGNVLIERFLHAYFHGKADVVLDCIADDFEWVNIALPKATVRGRDAIAAKLAFPNLGLPLPLEHADHETKLVLERGERVMHERVDRLSFGGRTLEIPCAAAFELRDGRLAA